MRVILKKEVYNLGDAGDIVKVAPGYGRNFLLPRGLAIPASESNANQAAHERRMADAIKRKQLAGAKELGARVDGMAVSIRRESGPDDRLFGSVSNRDIADALKEEGIEVDRKAIHLDEPIRTIGLFTVPVRLHREVTASLRVYVIRG
jgi:large subunit ribosomal protein L9